MSFWAIVHPDYVDIVRERGRARQRVGGAPAHYEIKIVTKGGEERWISLSGGQLPHQGRPAVIVTAFDITKRKRAEENLSKRNQELLSLLAAAQAMGGFLDLEAAARAICKAAIRAYSYRMAWIGLVVPETTEVKVLASAGYDEGYTEKLCVRWDLSEYAQGPCGRAINTRVPVVQRTDDADFAPWREAAIERGYAAICAIPLIYEDAVRGALTLYSTTPDAFDAQALSGLEIFARQATMAVVNASLYEEAKRIIEELGNVNEELLASRRLVEKQLGELQRGRAKLVASEARFRQLAETATAAIFIIRDFRYRYVNAFTEMETGYSREELLAMHSLQLVHPDHHGLVKSGDFVSREAGKGPSRHELKIVRRDGEIRWLDISVSVIEFEGQRSIIGTAYDITDRKKAEQSLQESERRYRELAETVSDWIWEVDDQFRYTYCSPRIKDILGYEPAEVLGRRAFDFMPTKEADRLRPVVADLVKKREEFHILENVSRHKDGSLRILETSAVPTFDHEGHFKGYQGIVRDITERRRIFETLRQSEEEFRRTFDLSPVGAVMVGLDYHFLRCNNAFCRFVGYAEGDLVGKTFLDVTHPEDKDIGIEKIRAVAKGALAEATFQKRYLRKDGGVVWGELTVGLVPDAKGRPAHFLTIVQDITERKSAEAELSAFQSRLGEIVEHSNNLFYSHTADHVLTYVSPQSRHFLGCEPEEAMVRWTDFITDNPVNEIGYGLTQKAIETGERQPPYELELKTKDGRTLWAQVNETPIVKDGKTVAIVGAVTDISGLKRAHLAVKETEKNLARLRAASPLPVISLDVECRVVEWNRAAETITGWCFEEVRGKPCPLQTEGAKERFDDFMAGVLRDGQGVMKYGDCRRRDGSLLSVDITGVSLHGSDGEVSGILAFLTERTGEGQD
jgi:PAS domain S-box-containing protein